MQSGIIGLCDTLRDCLMSADINQIFFPSSEEGSALYRLRHAFFNQLMSEMRIYRKVILWGAGGQGEVYYPFLRDRVIAIVDSNFEKEEMRRRGVKSPSVIKTLNPDCILVASHALEEIKHSVSRINKSNLRVVHLPSAFPLSIDIDIDIHRVELACEAIAAATKRNFVWKMADTGKAKVKRQVCVVSSSEGVLDVIDYMSNHVVSQSDAGGTMRLSLFPLTGHGLNKSPTLLPPQIGLSILRDLRQDMHNIELLKEISYECLEQVTDIIKKKVESPCLDGLAHSVRSSGDSRSQMDISLSWAREFFDGVVPDEHRVRFGYGAEKDQFIVYVIRSAARHASGLLGLFDKIANDNGLDIVGEIELNSDDHCELVACMTRGGVWNETHASEKGGLPWMLKVVCRKEIPRLERGDGRRPPVWPQRFKQLVREMASNQFPLSSVNWLHSADDSRESKQILRALIPVSNSILKLIERSNYV